MGCRCQKSDDWEDDDCSGDCGDGCTCESHDHGDDEDSTIPCPSCGRDIYEDSPQCPHCGEYIVDNAATSGRHTWLIIVGVILCLCAIFAWLVNS
jgi:hypothetical protein